MDLAVKPGVTIPERELAWSAVRSSGPGGQNVNKVASKVELRFDFEASSALTSRREDAAACAGAAPPRRRWPHPDHRVRSRAPNRRTWPTPASAWRS